MDILAKSRSWDRTYKASSVAIASLAAILCASSIGFILLRIARDEADAALEIGAAFSTQLHESVRSRLDQASGMAKLLAGLPVYIAPPDYRQYRTRLAPLRRSSLRLDADAYSVARESGYLAPVQGLLYHGLPLTDEQGRPILVHQRRLAADAVSSLPYVEAIAELDSLGRFVFPEPNSWQVENRYFDISKSAVFASVQRKPMRWLVHPSFADNKRQVMSFFVPIRRTGRIDGYLAVFVDVSNFISQFTSLKVPSSALSVSTSFQWQDPSPYTAVFATTQTSFPQHILAFVPSLISKWIVSSRARVANCDVHLVTAGEAALNCVQHFESDGLDLRTTIAAGLGAVSLQPSILFSFILLLVWPPVVASFSVRLFGHLWAQLVREKEELEPHLRAAADNLAHDLRGIVQSFKDELRIMRKSEIAPDAVSRMSKAVGRFELTTDNLRTSVLGPIRLDSSPTKIALYLPFVVRRSLDYYKSKYKAESVSLKYVSRDADHFISAHLDQLNRILGNVIDNAVEACRDTTIKNVVVEECSVGSHARLTIKDTGIGIAPGDLDRIFEPAFTTKGLGRGQGLAGCKQLVTDLGGTIHVDSKKGNGTTVDVLLPVVPAPRWFISRVVIRPDDVLVFVDDDEDMEDTWKARIMERLRFLEVGGVPIHPRCEFVSEPSELKSSRSSLIVSGTRFFVDFRLKNYHIDGLSLIEELGLQGRAVLVTNHFHDSVLLGRANEANVKVIPKEFLSETGLDLFIGG